MQQQDQILTVVSVKEDKDKNQKPYRRITVRVKEARLVTDPATKEQYVVRGKEVERAFNAYPNNYLNRPDPYYDAKVGEKIFGDIVTKTVTSYEIVVDGESREVTKYTCVVFGNTTSEDWNETVKAEFKRKGHELEEGIATESRQDVMKKVAQLYTDDDLEF